MEWNPLGWFKTKENPAQEQIQYTDGIIVSTDSDITYTKAFEKLETVSRGANLLISAASSLDFDIKDKAIDGIVINVRQKQLYNLLNFRPNPYQSIQEFRTHIYTDLVFEGNAFIYYDGAFLYHLPAANVKVHSDPKTFVSGYTYNGITEFNADEIIHIKDVGTSTVYRGTSRLASAERSIKTLYKMHDFQDQFFDNGAIAGIVIETENTLSQMAKDRTIQNWSQKYSTKNGARRPMILDSGLKLKSIGDTNFKDMDFDQSIERHNTKVLMALGVPEVLINGGNNANISPNLRLFYLETVLPLVRKYTSSMERFFGYDIEAVTSTVSSLQPELKEIAAFHSTLVNAGIITPNEARVELRYPKIDGQDTIRVPANIAGSAANPDQGGAPKKPPSEPNAP